jgi:hypothetical protein
MDRYTAYELASQRGFEGEVFHTEHDPNVGKVRFTRVTLEDENGVESVWLSEVSDVNGSECFSEWDKDSERFYAECRKTRRNSR